MKVTHAYDLQRRAALGYCSPALAGERQPLTTAFPHALQEPEGEGSQVEELSETTDFK